ncbi:hypothetical protein N431DRAFT_336028 [Stipitochalara longipes BDJ]|nr:hypothetical protein N431DRAFT_336028 [Stipitochalara longipes BDJ]
MGRPLFSNATEMVTFHVGKDGAEEKFTMHKESACFYSSVLKAAFEGGDQTYRLEDVRPNAFRLFVQWLYSGEFTTSDEEELSTEDIAIEKATEIVKNFEARDLDMAQLWLLAEKLKIPRLQNAVMKRFWEIFEIQGEKHDGKFWSTNWIPYIYEKGRTAPDSPLRHLAVDFVLYEVYVDWPAAHPGHLPHQMLLELSSRVSLVPVEDDMTDREFIHTRVDRNYMVAEEES